MLKMLLLRHISRATKAHHLVVLVFALFWCSAKETYPQDANQQLQAGYPSPSEHTRSYLFGSWDGKRDELAANGIVFDCFYIADLQANPVGGLPRAQAGWGRIRGTMDIDCGRLKDWNGLTFHATGVWQFGKNLGTNIGVLANPSGLANAHGIRMDLAELYGYVNRSLPDTLLNDFVDRLAQRIASFDKEAITEIKRLVDIASLPPDSEIAPEWEAFMRSLARPATQDRIKKLMAQGFHQPGDVENRLGDYLGQLGRCAPNP